MLIKPELVKLLLDAYNVKVNGILHIGAHNCEELPFYVNKLGVNHDKIVWIDALEDRVQYTKTQGILNVYQAVISDKDDEIMTFYRTNNDQSSSILELGTHIEEHPWVHVNDKYMVTTTTIDTFMESKGLDSKTYNFWNIDIQGAEYKALLGGTKSLKNVDALFLEVNTKELYKGCVLLPTLDKFLEENGFIRVTIEMTCHGWGDALYVKNKI